MAGYFLLALAVQASVVAVKMKNVKRHLARRLWQKCSRRLAEWRSMRFFNPHKTFTRMVAADLIRGAILRLRRAANLRWVTLQKLPSLHVDADLAFP